MLVSLAIRDLVLIERVALELGTGLAVLTGETGAGKSILLDGLGLALGERADAAMVRSGAQQAVSTATFQLPESHPALTFAAENDIALDQPGELVLRRTLKADGGILDPEAIAAEYVRLWQQPRTAWTHELDLRPWLERW